MGKRKICIVEEIEDRVAKNVTYCKRKKGIIKKAMELSILCGQDVSVTIYDPLKNKLISYQSSKKFSPKTVFNLLNVKK